MLMDLFFKTVSVEKKQRVHFNKFMRTVHDSKPIEIDMFKCLYNYIT